MGGGWQGGESERLVKQRTFREAAKALARKAEEMLARDTPSRRGQLQEAVRRFREAERDA